MNVSLFCLSFPSFPRYHFDAKCYSLFEQSYRVDDKKIRTQQFDRKNHSANDV